MLTSSCKRLRGDTLRLSISRVLLVFGWIGLLILPSCQLTGSPVEKSPLDMSVAALANPIQETDMIQTLRQLCQLLSTAPLTARTAATNLGTIIEDKGKDLPVIVQPSNPSFKEARVVRKVQTDEPAHVELVLANSRALSVEALQDAFGNYSELPLRDLDRPQRIIFYVDIPNLPRTCAVIADVLPGEQGVRDGTVTAVIVRRDVRLE